jgi:uncharacterized protein (DUF924 family)
LEPESVLGFWFGNAASEPETALARSVFWFGASPEADREIQERFGAVVDAAAGGALAAWEGDPRGALALVLVLDQFPRNIWRGRPEAFRHDPKALAAARRAVASGHLERLSPVEGVFLIMPYQHAESLECQRESVRLCEGLAEVAPAEWRPLLEGSLDFARQHLDLIERFGRFPHRNRALGRESTTLEQEHLEANGRSFGQG